MGHEGASVVISSRKEDNVENAVKSLRSDGITVEGIVCHVANSDHRKKLFEVASISKAMMILYLYALPFIIIRKH